MKRLPGIPWKARVFNAAANCWRAAGLPSLSRSAEDWVCNLRREWEQLGMTCPLAERDLERFLKCFLDGNTLSPAGVRSLWMTVHETMLRTADFEKAIGAGGVEGQHPLDNPLIVLGLPRTGTTLLQRLLLQYPASRCLRRWEIMVPFPAAIEDWGGPGDSRLGGFKTELGIKRLFFGDLNELHSFDSPEECWWLLISRFTSLTPFFVFGLDGFETFEAALTEETLAKKYAFYREQLEFLNAREPSSHWVLKSPEHFFHLNQLARTFPGGRFLRLHRSAPDTVASMCAMSAHLQRYCVRRLEPHRLGQQVLKSACLMVERMRAAEETRDIEVHHVTFRDLIDDPLNVVCKVYDKFGISFGAEARDQLELFTKTQMQGERSGIHYDLESFGLSEKIVRQAFGERYEDAGAP